VSFGDANLTRLGAKKEPISVGKTVDVTCTEHIHSPDQASNKLLLVSSMRKERHNTALVSI